VAISPADIEKKTFSTALRGYDLDEVDDFLDEMVVAVRELQEELAQARARAAELERDPDAPPVTTIGADESAVGRALVAAQQAADRLVEEARAEASRILEEARLEADTFARERDEKRTSMRAEMAEMTGLVAGVRTQLAVLATTVADKLDEMDAAVAGAQADSVAGLIEDEGQTQGADDTEDTAAEIDAAEEGDLEVVVEEVDDEAEGEDEADDAAETGLDLDLESTDTAEGDQPAGSAEIEGVDASEEEQEI
jgi:cell division initiation protein